MRKSQVVVNAELMFLVRIAIRPSKKLGFQSIAEKMAVMAIPELSPA